MLAVEASRQAYCPYSRFAVGAVAVSDAGKRFLGCNVENAAYGLAICAERNAVFQMVAQAERRLELMVIYTPTQQPVTPCGACRQVLLEFGPTARIISCSASDLQVDTSVDKLLPEAFGPRNLDI